MPTWPATLPQSPLKDGYSRAGKDLILRSPMDRGPAKTRVRTTAGTEPISLAFRMSTAQKEDFEAWVVTDLGHGVLAFEFPDPEAGTGTWLVKMTGGAGSPLYSVAPSVPGKWMVSFPAEIMPS